MKYIIIEKKCIWKFWVGRFLLFLLVIGVIWLINLIWFKFFNIRYFYEKVFIELVLESFEVIILLGLLIFYDMYKDELDDIFDVKNWEGFWKVKKDYVILLSYDFDK